MTLTDFIRSSLEEILDEWTRFAKTIPRAGAMDEIALRDHARGILLAIAADLQRSQSAAEQSEKSQGRARPSPIITEAELHGVSRFSEGFDVNESVAEFRALRASVLRLWEATLPLPNADDVTRFNEAIDQALAESLARFTEMKERRTRLFDALLSSSPDLFYIVQPTGSLIYANKAFSDVFKKTCGELAGADLLALSAPFVPDLDRHLRHVVESACNYRGEMHATLPNGETRTYEYLLVPVFNPSGQCEAVAGSARDITERKLAEDQIRRSANYDFLTGLPNRSLFHERLDHEMKHASRTGLPLALLFIDLDGFKDVNDRLGHAAGDELLRQVAARISACVRDTDTVARLGGDEFTVLLTDVTRTPHIQSFAAEILDEIRRPFSLAAGEVSISCSIGITVYPGDGSTPDALVRNADEAMYCSKNAGRDRYQFYTPVAEQPAGPAPGPAESGPILS